MLDQPKPSRPLHVAMVVHTLRHNNIGRVYPFLRAFVGSPEVRLTLVGWDGEPRFPLLRDLPWPVVALSGPDSGAAAVRRLSEALTGCDLVHCFKNRSHLITALAAAKLRGLPLVLDLDDWELGLFLEGVAAWPRWRQALWGRPVAARIAAALHLEELARTAPSATLVNSRALQGMFGGSVAYTAADAAAFDPIRADGAAFRVRHGIPVDAPLVGFLGTPHPHKGVESLLAAMALLRRELPAARLLVVGVPPHNAYYARLAADPAVTALGYVPADDYPHAYAACDVLAVPQRPVTEGIMQTPAKLILSLAAGKATVATTVGDIPAVLGAAGLLIPPDDDAALAAALGLVLRNPTRRAALGLAARARFLECFTLDHLRQQVLATYTQVRG